MRLAPTLMLLMTFSAPMGALAQANGAVASTQSQRQAAIELFGRSRTAYQDGKFKQAAELLRQAYALDPAPTLLYNLARALESDGDAQGAARAYAQYLSVDPKTKDRAAIEKRIDNLQAQIKERVELQRRLEVEAARKTAIETERTASVVTPAPAPAAPSPMPWIIAGTGGATLVVGGIFGILAQSKHTEAREEVRQAVSYELDQEARGIAANANIAYLAGGLMATTGIVWALLQDSPDDPDPEAGLTLTPLISPRSLGLEARF